MARGFVVALGLLGAIAFVAVPGCAVPETALSEAKFAGEMFCPAERVHARLAPDLVLEAPPEAIRDVPAWREPVPPPGVAEDPDRMRLWMVKRNAEYQAWANLNQLSRPSTNPTVARFHAMPIYEVSGCDTTRLYACDDVPTRRRGMTRGCEPIEKAYFSGLKGHVVCANGGILRARSGRADGMISSCEPPSIAGVPPNGAEPTGIAAGADLEAAQLACAASCASEKSCRASCEPDTAPDRATCSIDCTTGAARCRLGCAASAQSTCEARGLKALGMCASFDALERGAADTEAQLSAAQTKVHEMTDAAKRLREESGRYQTCANACRDPIERCASAAGSSSDAQKACRSTFMGCLLGCSRSSRQRCESFAPTPSWCAGFRSSEESMEREMSR